MGHTFLPTVVDRDPFTHPEAPKSDGGFDRVGARQVKVVLQQEEYEPVQGGEEVQKPGELVPQVRIPEGQGAAKQDARNLAQRAVYVAPVY